MPKLSQISIFRLSTCHDDLVTLFTEVIKHVDCVIVEGYRGKAAQEAAFLAGKSKLHYPDGKHNKTPSMAVDVCPYPIPPWKKTADFIYFAGMVMGIASMLKAEGKMTHEIKFGGDWNQNDRVTDESFSDCVHFEVVS